MVGGLTATATQGAHSDRDLRDPEPGFSRGQARVPVLGDATPRSDLTRAGSGPDAAAAPGDDEATAVPAPSVDVAIPACRGRALGPGVVSGLVPVAAPDRVRAPVGLGAVEAVGAAASVPVLASMLVLVLVLGLVLVLVRRRQCPLTWTPPAVV